MPSRKNFGAALYWLALICLIVLIALLTMRVAPLLFREMNLNNERTAYVLEIDSTSRPA